MIAARPIQDLSRGLGRNAFDLPVAALAAAAAAFLAFAMPADLLGRLVSATGLPHLLAAAEPPLGFKARAAIGIVAAALSFGLVYLLLRKLGGSGGRRARPEPELEEEERPRLRRRDFHPDAPACRPLSANRDFGEPAPPALTPARPFVSAEPFPLAEPFPPAEPFQPADPFPRGEQQAPAWFAETATEPEAEEEEGAPIRAAQPEQAPEPEERAAPIWSEESEEPLELTERPAPAWLAEPEPEAIAPEPEIRSGLADARREASLDDLMRRLERGLARRRTPQIFAPPPHQHAPAPQVFPEANDDRLQSAIESLQRFAARGE